MDDPWLDSLKQVDSFRNNRTIEHALIVSKFLVYLNKENNMPDNLTAANLVMRTATADGPSGGAAGANKLWLPLWSGEVINSYDQYNVFENMINHKTISGGFSYEFPITGTIALNPAWEAGEELVGGDSSSTTFKVNLDKRPMAAHFETDNVDLLVTQWDYRSELARQAGLTLANTRDRQIAIALAAACAVPQIATDPRGLAAAAFQAPASISTSVVASACTEAEALKVLQEIENYLVTCQENDLPVENVYCAVRPKVFQVIRALGIPRTTNANGLSYTGPVFGASDSYGGAGAPIGVGMNMLSDTLDYMGVKIIKTNHLGSANYNVTADNLGGAKYNLNCAANSFVANGGANGLETLFSFYGIIFQPEAIAGLSLMGMKVDTVQDVRRNTQFTVASMMKGTGVIRPELCRALVSGSLTAASVTRAKLAEHFNSASTSGPVVAGTSTEAAANLTNGFAAEYAVT